MALTTYKRKRSFDGTPEPQGGKSSGTALRFVVQKHHASRLHYDFRLELGGALKSWAVPKGPSLNPKDRRLAMHVEDHPYAYKDFEGIIPKGNYGAGTVIVWDEGTYEPLGGATGKAAQAKSLLKQYRSGSMKIVLHGQKLKGEFALVRMKSDENAWLLIKHNDRYATTDDVLAKDKSVKSQKTLETLRNAAGKPANLPEETLQRELKTKPKQKPITDLRKAAKAPFPRDVTPMLATLTEEPFDDPDWEFEVKWDGYRALAFIDGKKTGLRSRNGITFDGRFHPVFEAVKAWDIRAVVDGEIVVVNDDGTVSFGKLQNWRSEADGYLAFYVFDILWHDGRDLTTLPLSQRKAVLATLLPKSRVIRSGYSVAGRGIEFFEAARALGMEGIIAKRSDSRYHPGTRSPDWRKVKAQRRQEVIIAGYTKLAGTSKPFSSLLLGVYEKGKLRYAGKVGTGFNDQEQRELLKRFKPLERKTPPFPVMPDYNKASRFRPVPANAQVTWLRPTLVCEIHFSEITDDGVFRHPAFIALRDDKAARDVTTEHPEKQSKVMKKEKTKKIGGIELSLTNLDKVYWPADGYTKGDVLEYYHRMARYILPYLKGRPQSLNRFPDGIDGPSFYQKDVTGKVPEWVEKYPYKAEGDRRRKHYMLCNNEAALLYMANLGAIEMNPWSSTVDQPDKPDWCILDLDPDNGNTFAQVTEVAQAIHGLLRDLAVPSHCKTSGSTGLHIYIPLGARYSYDQSQLFAKWIAATVDDELDFTSVERATGKRKGKIYIDYLQNRPAATLAAPYSLRPKPGATVSMPLHWDEVNSKLKISDFNIENAWDRVQSEGDLFKPVLKKGIDLKKILGKLQP